ncbi:excinuclease ABC subunit UvrC [Tropheryma whipplei]|uniref:excinuclease ABC subunit UvrC n=1 Tax=Tropheryma whipplei TaxID=2039 RepID=UPI0004B65530|nr:excinuclease ABC subunit UvrC [Tropheryma whipplei]MCO8190211.1 excinuclease ABC subunit UvrC [Tropheryma whipplei]
MYPPRRIEIPCKPGVYRFEDENGRILYVGKAKNLRNRLGSYFTNARRGRRISYMLSISKKVGWTCVADDIEALRLEYSWIKEFAPPCNVKLKDDKAYPFLAVTIGEQVPRLLITRRKIQYATHFGPYPKVFHLRETVSLLHKIFQIRTCSPTNYKRAIASGMPCFEGQINKCFGPCSLKTTHLQYQKRIKNLMAFLEGQSSSLLESLKKKMLKASKNKEYEEAAILRDKIQAAQTVLSRSAVLLDETVSADFIAVVSDNSIASVQCFRVIAGRIKSVYSWHFEQQEDQSASELLSQSIIQVYDKLSLPKRIVLFDKPSYLSALSAHLNDKNIDRSLEIEIVYHPNEQERRLLETVKDNALSELERHRLRRSSDYTERHRSLFELQKYLNLNSLPVRIECFDISHLLGTNTSGSMVVFENGEPKKSAYRHFNIHIDQNNDTASMFSLICRRLRSLESVAQDSPDYPQLMIIDGGKPQLSAAVGALQEVGLKIPVFALSKRLEELWSPGVKTSLILPPNSESLFLLQKIRDESHRFALKQQTRRREAYLTSELFRIPGLGKQKVMQLLRRFSSFAEIRQASIEDISALPGFGVKTAEKIKECAEAFSLK